MFAAVYSAMHAQTDVLVTRSLDVGRRRLVSEIAKRPAVTD